ncbi:hypothetical protein [Xylanimonas ulmi]|uniref:Uncharacterized protein n=1 Tax=Xylanimonas ulmi TaxID=228973 RepID=A0A4Q7M6I4_9MICO|nr:hypothetical protein [Xylanibacterium ulmi]RZS63111.1 hypothetical protein EV386_3469 [Xylanibacterium ulmi]
MSITTTQRGRLRRMAGGLTIVLPGSWINVPLADPEETTAFVRRVVRERVGVADRLARMRRLTADDLVANARDAAKVGVHTYLMALELYPGIPFPAALLLFDASWPQGSAPAPDATAQEVGAALAAAFPDGELGHLSHGAVSRTATVTKEPIADTDSVRLTIDYRIPYPDRTRLLVGRATIPALPSAEPFATLIDAIVDSIQFPVASADAVR